MKNHWYLDCYFYGAVLGDRFPVNSYGPAGLADVMTLRYKMEKQFDRVEVTTDTKGQNPLPRNLWPGEPRIT